MDYFNLEESETFTQEDRQISLKENLKDVQNEEWEKRDKIFLVDSNAIICRYFFALDELFSPEGLSINGLYGFCSMVNNFMKKYSEASFLFLFDICPENFRKKICADYKGNRPRMDSALKVQISLAIEFCKIVGFPFDHHLNYEADDLIATYARKFSKHYKEVVILSLDKDIFQLINHSIFVMNPFTKKISKTEDVVKKFGVFPTQIPLFLALMGDKADNIKGIDQIGPQRAKEILQKTSEIDEIRRDFTKYDFKDLEKMLSLTELFYECPIKYEDPPKIQINYDEMDKFFNNFGFEIK